MLMTLVLGLAGCGPDEEMLAKQAELEEVVTELNGELERAEQERDYFKSRVERLETELKDQRTREIYARLGVDMGQPITATFQTSMGNIDCELLPQYAPVTVLNFVELAEGSRQWTDPRTGTKTTRPLYNGTIFHRVIPKFMVQAGDPLGKGTGGPGYRFEDEVNDEQKFTEVGMLAMANSGANTNGSQFFITDSTPEHLNGKHTIFGQGCAPMETVRAIAGVERDKRDKPKTPVTINAVIINR